MVDANRSLRSTSDGQPLWRGLAAPVIALICFGVGLIQSPIPGVNESHWLGKARAFWDPGWCSQDFFFRSANAHYLFLAVTGAAAQVLPLPAVALLGRAVASLAVGWSLAFLIGRGAWLHTVLVTALFLLAQWLGNFSGEWLVGGLEAKQFSYALLFVTFAALDRSRFRLAAATTGLAVATHPVVGAWGTIAVGGACLVTWGRSRWSGRPTDHVRSEDGLSSLTVRQFVECGAIALASALPGLIPALAVLRSSTDASVAQAATLEQVYGRLRHHLDPTAFSSVSYWYYSALLLLWLALTWRLRGRCSPAHDGDADRSSAWCAPISTTVVMAVDLSLIIAGCGMAIGWGAAWADGRLTASGAALGEWSHRAAACLKFYPFRIADLLLSLGVSWALANTIPVRGRAGTLAMIAGTVLILSVVTVFPSPFLTVPTDRELTPELWADWKAAGRWIRESTPRDALFVTPTYSRHFKWWAERAEFVCHKDCPQDAAGIIEWRRRMTLWRSWRQSAFNAGVGREELSALARQTGGTHLIIHHAVPVDRPPLYRNRTFAVYELN